MFRYLLHKFHIKKTDLRQEHSWNPHKNVKKLIIRFQVHCTSHMNYTECVRKLLNQDPRDYSGDYKSINYHKSKHISELSVK